MQFLHPSTCPGRSLECSIMLVCTASAPSSSVKLQAQVRTQQKQFILTGFQIPIHTESICTRKIHGHVVARKIVREVFAIKIKVPNSLFCFAMLLTSVFATHARSKKNVLYFLHTGTTVDAKLYREITQRRSFYWCGFYSEQSVPVS